MLSRRAATDLMRQLVPAAEVDVADHLLSPGWDLVPVQGASDVAVEIGGPGERVEPLDHAHHPRGDEVLIATIDAGRLPAFDPSWGVAPLSGSSKLFGIYADVTASSTEPVGARVVEVRRAAAGAPDRGQPRRLPFGSVSARARSIVTVPEFEVFAQVVDDASEDEWLELRAALVDLPAEDGAVERPDRAKLEAEIEALTPGPEQNELIYQYSLLGLHDEVDALKPSAQLLGAPKTVEIDVREFGPLVYPELGGGEPAAWHSLLFFHNGFGGLDFPLGGGLYVLSPDAQIAEDTGHLAVLGFEIS